MMSSPMGDIFDVLSLIIEKLDSIDVPYMLSGSVAAALYAEPRFTNDIDIVIHTYRSKKIEIYNVFKEKFYISEQSIDDAFNSVGIFNPDLSLEKRKYIIPKGILIVDTVFDYKYFIPIGMKNI